MRTRILVLLAIAFLAILGILISIRYDVQLNEQKNRTPDEKVAGEEGEVRRVQRIGEAELIFCHDLRLPYIGRENQTEVGYVVDLLEEIYSPLDYNLTFLQMPISRCVSETQRGICTAIACCDDDRIPAFIYPKTPVVSGHTSFYVNAELPWRYEGIHSLDTCRLGFVQGYVYSPELDGYIRANMNAPKVYRVSGDEPVRILIQALMRNRITTFAGDMNVVAFTLKSMDLKDGPIVQASEPEPDKPYFVAFSPNDPRSAELAKIFDQRFNELRAQGKIDELKDRYDLASR